MSGARDPAKLEWLAKTLGVVIGGRDDRATLDGFTRRLNGMMPAIRDAMAAKLPVGQEIRTLVADAGELARNQKFDDAHRRLDTVQEKLVGVQSQTQTGGQDGLTQWKAARGIAVASLTMLEAAVRRSPHPQKDAAIILLRAVRANLTEAPETPQQVAELESYLTTDGIIAAAETPNVFGIQIALRTPLLQALTAMRSRLAIAGGKAA
jgi:hypothetical protein